MVEALQITAHLGDRLVAADAAVAQSPRQRDDLVLAPLSFRQRELGVER
jgi:hypothetical protein